MRRNRTRKGSPWKRIGIVLLGLALPLASGAQAAEKVLLKHSWIFGAEVAPVFAAIDKGYFKAEGIDLDFQDGRGSGLNMQLLAARSINIGFVDLGTAAEFISQGANSRGVFGWSQVSPQCILTHADLNIQSIKDLEGKRVGRTPAGSDWLIFPAVAKRNNIDISKMNLISVTGAARNTAFLNRDVDAVIAYCPDNIPYIESKGGKVKAFRYADLGVNTLGKGIVAHNKFLEEKPSLVRRLLRAYSRGIQYSRENRDETVRAMKEHSPLTVKDVQVARAGLDQFMDLLHTKNSKGKPLGWMAREDWVETIDILKVYGGLKNPLPPEKYYTNEFITMDIM